MTNGTIAALINPLAFLEVDPPWAEVKKAAVTSEAILRFLANPGDPREMDDLVARYRKISIENPRLFAAPAEARLLERMIWPLRQAKGAFMLGHYLGTISLVGMVAEMAAILNFDLENFRINGQPLDEKKQKELFGSAFERLGQERRVEVLAAYGVIPDALKQDFDLIRTKRRRYLHLWSSDHASLANDAVQCFTAGVRIVVGTLGLSVDDGKLILRQEILEYLAKHNIKLEPIEQEGNG